MKQLMTSLIIMVTLLTSGCAVGSKVEFVRSDEKIDVMIDGAHLTSYVYSDDLTKPILYPVNSPSGLALNRGYPIVQIEGETTDHPHHAGLFFTYDKVNGEGFWANKDAPPQVKHMKVTQCSDGKGKGKISTTAQWVGKSGAVLLNEERQMVFIAGQDEYAIDFTFDLSAPRDSKVVFEDTKEGMFAIRVADWLREKDGTGRYLSSNGDETEKNIWGKRAEWVRLEAQKDGKTVGIAIFNHPSSVNFPTYWHARGYGLFSANPLGQYDFERKRNPDKAQHFNLTLDPGQSARFRFRMLVYEGTRTKEQLQKTFEEFAK
ncbi:MAG: DUF6807 domain-containing protein [Planctomycetota bacterium]